MRRHSREDIEDSERCRWLLEGTAQARGEQGGLGSCSRKGGEEEGRNSPAVAPRDRQMVSHDWLNAACAACGSGFYPGAGEPPFSCLGVDVAVQVLQKRSNQGGRSSKPRAVGK